MATMTEYLNAYCLGLMWWNEDPFGATIDAALMSLTRACDARSVGLMDAVDFASGVRLSSAMRAFLILAETAPAGAIRVM